MRKMHRAWCGALGVLLWGQVACFGPITATKGISDAAGALERARVADAKERAPYYYYSAENFLQKAKEEWGYSDFQAADQYAQEALRFAKRALTQAKEDPWTGSPVPASKLEALRVERGIKPPKSRAPGVPSGETPAMPGITLPPGD